MQLFSFGYNRIIILCAVVMVVILTRLYTSTIPAPYFLPSHLILEISSIVASFAVFAVGWFGFKQTGDNRDRVISITFAIAGAFDFIHTLSYKGMPDFLVVNSPGKAAAFWLLARLAIAVGLLLAVFIDPASKRRSICPQGLIIFALMFVVGVTTVVNIFSTEIARSLYPHIGQPPSLLKSVLEYVVIGLYMLTFFLLSEKRGWQRDIMGPLKGALIIASFGEVAFTLYLSPYSWMNALGHIYKTTAYYLILNALFVSAVKRPYEQLSTAKDELQALYHDAREHRKEIEQSFSRIGSALSSSLRAEEALGLISDLAAEMLHVDCSVVVSLDKAGNTSHVAAREGGCHKADRPVEATLFVGKQAVEARKTVVVNDLQSTGWIDCDFSYPNCLRSMACTPMIYEDTALGVVAIYSHKKSAFEEGDLKLLEGFAVHAAIALHNAFSYERESRIADVLQKSFLSSSNIVSDQFEIAQVYQPAMDEALVGGDFYDVFEAPDGRLGLVIGDVSGKGLKAAVHTAMAKYSLRAYAYEGHSPGKALHLLDKAVNRVTDVEVFITLFYGLLDTHTGELVYASAGHEPPIYSCGKTGLTLPATGPALGAGINLPYDEGSLSLKAGCILLLYTDGISEARQGNNFLGIDGISEKLQLCGSLSSEEVAKCVHNAAIEYSGGYLKDDVALLAVRMVE